MSPAPRVAVLIGAFDSERTLARAIASILVQSVSDLELIVIDDGSRDRSLEVARAATADDPRARVVSLPQNLGIPRSLNLGLAEVSAPAVAFQDADDFSEPFRLERQLNALDADPSVAVVGCRMRELDERGRELRPRTSFASGDVGPVLMRFNPIPNGCAMVRRAAVVAAGGYDVGYRYAAEYDLWLRLSERHRIAALEEVLCTRTMGSSNVAAYAERRQLAESIRARLAALRRRRTLRGAGGIVRPAASLVVPLGLKRALRARRGQAP
jgi:glycosyltransferase involved in cell wall biosynthesis